MVFDNPKVYGDTFISDGLVLVLSSLLITSYFRGSLPGGRLRREKVDKDGRELPTEKKGVGELPTGGLLASGCTTAYRHFHHHVRDKSFCMGCTTLPP